MNILQAIAATLIKLLAGWISARAAARKQAAVAANVDRAQVDGAAAAQRVQQVNETARDTTHEALVTARAAAARPDGLHAVNQTVAAAIARANADSDV